MRAIEIITGHVIYNPAYTYKFQLKTTLLVLSNFSFKIPIKMVKFANG